VTSVRPLPPDEWRTLRDLRLAALRDAPDALGGDHESARDWSEDRWRGWPARGVPVAAMRGGEPVGLVGVVGAPADPATAHLVALWVAPGARGSGVGDDLVDAVLAQAREWGCSSVLLEVLPANVPAIRLYRRHGFTVASDPAAAPGAVTMRRLLR
jgi:ribosomal protein S18 acetylase RimI-like enzyme